MWRVQFIDWGLLPRALLGVLALVCGNGYIVGINQIYDVEVDKVNKPFLPVAAGALHALGAQAGALSPCKCGSVPCLKVLPACKKWKVSEGFPATNGGQYQGLCRVNALRWHSNMCRCIINS